MCGRVMATPLVWLLKVAQQKFISFEVQENVTRAQRRYARNLNQRKHAKAVSLKQGQRVHVRENIRSNKYERIWTQHRTVASLGGYLTVCLDDGAVRNASDLVPYRAQPPGVVEAPPAEPPVVVALPLPPAVLLKPQPAAPQPSPALCLQERTCRRPACYADIQVDFWPRKGPTPPAPPEEEGNM